MSVLTDIGAPTTVLTIERLADLVIDERGHHVTSRYCEAFWLPTLGPSALWLLRHTSYRTEHGPYVVASDALGRSLGLGGGMGRGQPLRKTLDRLVQFHCALGWGDTWQLRTHLPDLGARQLHRLPESLRAAHARHAEAS